jgi:hypothetical protein
MVFGLQNLQMRFGCRARGTIAVLLLLLTACSDAGFKGTNKTRPTPTPKQEPAVKFEHAVFAVRDLGCAMCHAKVDSNIITDMMAGSDGKSQHQTIESWLYMSQHEIIPSLTNQNLTPAAIQGRIIVPKTNVQHDGAITTVTTNTPDKSRCISSVKSENDINWSMPASAVAISIKETMDKCVTPYVAWGAGSSKVEERDTVLIDPPTTALEITAIASRKNILLTQGGITALPSYDATSNDASLRPMATHSGFVLANGAVKVSGAATCEGALLIDAPVYFDNVNLRTAKGCRIYATASIFIKGKMEVVNTGSSESAKDVAALMLMSPTFIGFHIPVSMIDARLKHPINLYKTFRAGSPAAIVGKISADAAKAGFPKFTDDEMDGTAAAIDYRRIVATAPVVYSRMKGQFSGAIVAEHFMGKVGSLSFIFDPVLERAPFYPELILDVRDGKNIVSTGNNQATQ